MVYSVQKLTIVTVIGLSLAMTLLGCSRGQDYKREVNDDTAYLDSPMLSALTAPPNISLPVPEDRYAVRLNETDGLLGKALDIRPPAQPLALLEGSRTQYTKDSAILLIENTPQYRQLWRDVVQAIEKEGVTIADRQDAQQTLTTGWVTFNRGDEDVPYQGRYQILVQSQGYQTALVVKSLALRQGETGSGITEPSEIQRYTVDQLNTIIEELNQQQTTQLSTSNREANALEVQSSTDDTGLPVLIVRAPYAQVWDRLSTTLGSIGMKVSGRNRSQGTLEIAYKSLGEAAWKQQGVKDPELKEGNYRLQVGDLDNRTSLQFLDMQGQPLTQAQNETLVALFKMAFNR